MQSLRSTIKIRVSQIIAMIELFFGGVCVPLVVGIAGLFLVLGSKRVSTFLIVLILGCLLIGVFLIRSAIKRMHLISLFKLYVSHLSNDETGSIASLANVMGMKEKKVETDLNYMIKKGYFHSAYIDKSKHCIVINSDTRSHILNFGKESDGYLVMTCKCCGGTTKVPKDKIINCDYCGMPMKASDS